MKLKFERLQLFVMGTGLLGICAAAPAFGHTFWMEGTEAGIALRIGHPGDASPYSVGVHRISSLREYRPDECGGWKIQDRQGVFGDMDDDAILPLTTEGAPRLLALETIPAFSELPADQFDDYVAESGLTVIAEARGESEEAGRETYSRRSKILVGKIEAEADYEFGVPIGQTLEIVPLSNPTHAGTVDFQLLYRGVPAEGLTVGLVNLDMAVDQIASRVTDSEGMASFDLVPGRWLIKSIWASPVPEGERADWDTIFSTLTFETAEDKSQ